MIAIFLAVLVSAFIARLAAYDAEDAFYAFIPAIIVTGILFNAAALVGHVPYTKKTEKCSILTYDADKHYRFQCGETVKNVDGSDTGDDVEMVIGSKTEVTHKQYIYSNCYVWSAFFSCKTEDTYRVTIHP